MKKFIVNISIGLLAGLLFQPLTSIAQDKKEKILADATEAKSAFIKSDNTMERTFASSYGYVIFPNVGKGAVGIGGAAGNGILYEKGNAVGMAKMKQLTVGLQLGGQSYREVIFFETAEAFKSFQENKFEFAAQVSAVAVKSGISANAKYKDGVMVFTQEKGGLMYEASIGGQKFHYDPF